MWHKFQTCHRKRLLLEIGGYLRPALIRSFTLLSNKRPGGKKFRHALTPAPIRGRLLFEAESLLEVLRYVILYITPDTNEPWKACE